MGDRRRTSLAISLVQLAAAAAAAVAVAGVGEWDTVIFALLVAFALIGDRLEVDTKVVTISGAFLAVGLAMVLLGPLPAAAIGVMTMAVDSLRRRPPVHSVASNLATFTIFPLIGGLGLPSGAAPWDDAPGARHNTPLLLRG